MAHFTLLDYVDGLYSYEADICTSLLDPLEMPFPMVWTIIRRFDQLLCALITPDWKVLRSSYYSVFSDRIQVETPGEYGSLEEYFRHYQSPRQLVPRPFSDPGMLQSDEEDSGLLPPMAVSGEGGGGV